MLTKNYHDEYDNEYYEIFSVLSSACAWTNVILAGKRGSPRRHSTTNFSENVEVEKTSYQLFEALSFCDRESAYTSSLEVTVLTFLVNNGKMNFSHE